MRRTAVVIAVGLLLLASAPGCRTRWIGSPRTTDVPRELTAEEAEIAIVAMLAAPRQIGADPDVRGRVLASPLGALLWKEFRRSRLPAMGWYRIHKNARVWIARFERNVEDALAIASETKRRLGPDQVGESASREPPCEADSGGADARRRLRSQSA